MPPGIITIWSCFYKDRIKWVLKSIWSRIIKPKTGTQSEVKTDMFWESRNMIT